MTTASLLPPDARCPGPAGCCCRGQTVPALDASLAKDPFYVNGVAEFEVLEFAANRVAPGFENLLDA